MANQQESPIWSLVIWGGATLVMTGAVLWCVIDGWFRPGYEYVAFSRLATPFCAAAAAWCAWKGVKEYKQVKDGQQGQGAAQQQEGESGAGHTPAGDPATGRNDAQRP